MKSFSKSAIAVFGALAIALTFACNVSAAQYGRPDRDKDSRKPVPQRRIDRKITRPIPMPRPGQVRSRLPKGHWSVRQGHSNYFYHRGTFYRRGPSGYVVVKAPVGAVVLGLPFGYHRFFLGGGLYFTFGGVYYRRVPAGYVVVEPPREVVVQPPAPVVEEPLVAGDQVKVSAEQLNVRLGPGLDRTVVGQVSRGTVLTVQGSTEEWWYVELPDGRFGWVLARFTTPLPEPASG